MTPNQKEARDLAEGSLHEFIKLIAPHRVLSSSHLDVLKWWTREDAKDHQLLLFPRDHQKSAMVAYRVVWELTKDPSLTFLYMSATAGLAEKQLYFIKGIMTSKTYMKHWPDMITPTEGKREKWTATEICVDHPRRSELGIRDASITTAGLTKTITGLHFDVAVLDDIVVRENAYTGEGRGKVAEAYSLLASIETTGSREWVVGTRYHPKDLYSELISMEEEYWEKEELVETRQVYEIMERSLEDSNARDGSGEYLWPKMARYDGRMFGFDRNERSRKYAKYLDKTQFYSQYYNDPSDPGNLKINPALFQYYDRERVSITNGVTFIGTHEVKVYAAMDFAVSTRKGADYTALVVVGIDELGSYFVMDVVRFKTSKISTMFEAVMNAHLKWNFIKIRMETSAAQKAIVEQIKDMQRDRGLFFSIDEFQPNKTGGNKEERMLNILKPRYEAQAIWHYSGGNTSIMEDELMSPHPSHDDVIDALSNAIDIAKRPAKKRSRMDRERSNVIRHRFGGTY